MAKATHYEQRVTVQATSPGREFPLDMLRYDSCVPATETDAGIIAATLRGDHERLQAVGWTGVVTLRRFSQTKGAMLTSGRWESFGWRVVSHDVREY
jgi:hypothetical protein